ncbi:hypothetical protein VTG60DRAFT_5458 [Thermothelomyces hinnuleus]
MECSSLLKSRLLRITGRRGPAVEWRPSKERQNRGSNIGWSCFTRDTSGNRRHQSRASEISHYSQISGNEACNDVCVSHHLIAQPSLLVSVSPDSTSKSNPRHPFLSFAATIAGAPSSQTTALPTAIRPTELAKVTGFSLTRERAQKIRCLASFGSVHSTSGPSYPR